MRLNFYVMSMLALLLLWAVPAMSAPPEPAPCNCFARVIDVKQAIGANTPRSNEVVSLYVAGVSDAGQGIVHCAPGEVGTTAVMQLVGPPLLAADDAEIAARVVMRVLKETYPCDAGGKPVGPSKQT